MKKNLALLSLTLAAAVVVAVFYTSIAHGEVELRPSLSGKKLHAVLLGDSYSAGNGAGNYYGPDECYRSGNNWAHIYLNSLVERGISLTFNNKACGGATTESVIIGKKDEEKKLSRNFPLKESRTSIERKLRQSCATKFSDEISGIAKIQNIRITSKHDNARHQEVTYTCERTIKAQADFVGPQTDLVMFSIGGNNLEFKDIVKSCFALFARNRNKCENAINYAKDHLSEVKNRYKKRINPTPRQRSAQRCQNRHRRLPAARNCI